MATTKKTETTDKPLSLVQRQIHETIYKPLIKQAIKIVEDRCTSSRTGEEFTIAAVCTEFGKLADEEFSASRFRDTLLRCGFIFQRITVIREDPTGIPE